MLTLAARLGERVRAWLTACALLLLARQCLSHEGFLWSSRLANDSTIAVPFYRPGDSSSLAAPVGRKAHRVFRALPSFPLARLPPRHRHPRTDATDYIEPYTRARFPEMVLCLRTLLRLQVQVQLPTLAPTKVKLVNCFLKSALFGLRDTSARSVLLTPSYTSCNFASRHRLLATHVSSCGRRLRLGCARRLVARLVKPALCLRFARRLFSLPVGKCSHLLLLYGRLFLLTSRRQSRRVLTCLHACLRGRFLRNLSASVVRLVCDHRRERKEVR